MIGLAAVAAIITSSSALNAQSYGRAYGTYGRHYGGMGGVRGPTRRPPLGEFRRGRGEFGEFGRGGEFRRGEFGQFGRGGELRRGRGEFGQFGRERGELRRGPGEFGRGEFGRGEFGRGREWRREGEPD